LGVEVICPSPIMLLCPHCGHIWRSHLTPDTIACPDGCQDQRRRTRPQSPFRSLT
jgi:hypothetical protein